MRNKTYDLTLIACVTAVTCILGPLSIPIGPVPISLTNLVIYFSAYILGSKKSVISCFLYLLIGLVGLPVFSSFSGGFGKLFGPTGGYLIAFLITAFISGFFIERFPNQKWMHAVGMVIGTIILYIFGTAWLAFQAGLSFPAALAAGVIPFIPGDLCKIIIALIIGPVIKSRIKSF